jgi:hypothetical protein
MPSAAVGLGVKSRYRAVALPKLQIMAGTRISIGTIKQRPPTEAAINRSDKALCTPAFDALIDMMHESRRVRFGAGKAHLGAASYALRVYVALLGFVLWHCKPKLHGSKRSGNQPEFALRTCDTVRFNCRAIYGRAVRGPNLIFRIVFFARFSPLGPWGI